ncbi:Malectin-like domain [Dillenia turbinata]|uniref:Malectin-like domain n=1 Tax=Dillenia turbinata TaxID=194707 RepID=A0AAN8VKH9_9MAGN
MADPKWVFLISLICFDFLAKWVLSKPFDPSDGILINCGGDKPIVAEDGRTFEPDSGNSNVKFSPNSHIVVPKVDSGLLNNSYMYVSARVFTETSTYAIKTKHMGRHWLRLHFYAFENVLYELESAVFSVVVNGITLLPRLKIGDKKSDVKEYVIDVSYSDSKNLVMTFSPSNGSVAYVNAIEVVPIPSGIFPSSALQVPLGTQVEISSYGNVAFETAYRINMGGPLITPKNDTLWRIWEPDKPFLVNPFAAHSASIDPSTIKYPSGVSAEIAPNWVYATAQEMADAKVSNQRFNVSWAFKVDGGFGYLIRMHFCDIVSAALNNLVFNVYVNNQSALSSFDISSKTMELSAAYFVDFVTNVSLGSNRILVQVGPSNIRSYPSNALLNGLEIMKTISNFSYKVDVSMASRTNKWLIPTIAGLVGLAIGVIIISAAFLLFSRCLKKPKQDQGQPTVWLPLPTHAGNSESKVSTGSCASASPSLNLGRVLAFSEICEVTNNFDESLLLGVGGFGKVYKGVLENGVVVAIKRGNPRSQQGLNEFRTEIQMLSKLRHRHLQVNIAEWAMKWQKKGQLEKVIDPHLVGHANVESLRKFGETAEKCLAEHGSERPTMGDVLWNLEYALQLQEASMQSVKDENSTNNIPDDWIPEIELNDDGEEIVNDQESDATTSRSGVFSQIIDPRGR